MKKSELEAACKAVLPDGTYEALRGAEYALPPILKMACDEAFVYDLTGPPVEILREAAKMMRSPGWFDFDPEDE